MASATKRHSPSLAVAASPPRFTVQTVVRATRTLYIAKGVLGVVYGALWLALLQRLNGATASTIPFRQCRDVAPGLQRLLYALAWVCVVLGSIAACAVLAKMCAAPRAETFVLLLAYAVLLYVYVNQIRYVQAVRQSDHTMSCDAIERRRRRLVALYAVVVIVLGAFLALFGLTGETLLGQMYERLVGGGRRGR